MWTQVVTYEDLFGLPAGRVPDFRVLESASPPVSTANDPEGRGAALTVIEPIRERCRAMGWEPLLVELALIADPRHLADPGLDARGRHFTSVVCGRLPDADRVTSAYERALRRMEEEETKGSQIVPHRELYNRKMGYIAVSMSDVRGSAEQCYKPLPNPEQRTIVARQNFNLIGGDARVDVQAQVFATKLIEELEKDGLDKTVHLMNGATLVILPFVRPYVGGHQSPVLRGSPGGAVFLVLVPLGKQMLVPELVRAIAWLLAEASIQQSYASLDVEIERGRVFGELLRVFGHGVANHMKAAGLVNLRAQAETKDTIDAVEVASTLDMVWPVWGIGGLTKIATMKPGEMRVEWLDPGLEESLDDQGYLPAQPTGAVLEAQVRAAVIRQVAARCVLQGDAGGAGIKFSFNGMDVPKSQWQGAGSGELWPFTPYAEDRSLPGTTLVTLGLFEHLANALRYLYRSGLPANKASLDVATHADDGVLQVTVRQALSPGDWRERRVVESRTIEAVRGSVEPRLISERGAITATTPFVVDLESPFQVATWTFAPRRIRWSTESRSVG